jgi:hypothetical protein
MKETLPQKSLEKYWSQCTDLIIRTLKIQISTGVQTEFGWLGIQSCILGKAVRKLQTSLERWNKKYVVM